MRTTSAPFVLKNTYITDRKNINELRRLIAGPMAIDRVIDRVAYISDTDEEIVEIVGFDSVVPLSLFLEGEKLNKDSRQIRELMTQDIRREILKIHTTVKGAEFQIPTAENLQIRFIEVPGVVLDEYFEWRKKTIFKHVEGREDVGSFLAYHSLVSSNPGVTFLVEYTGSYENLMEGFTSPQYREIVRQADRFIVGGNVNLSTKGYKRIFSAEKYQPKEIAKEMS